jgi:DMSO reductase anchor subunit
MDLALLQMPMVLFTTLVPMASGAFVGLALAFLTSRFSKECLARIDRWTLLPMAILAVGYIASFVALSSPQYSMSLFQGVDIAPLSFVGVAGMLFIALAVVYWIIAMTGNLDERPRKVFATVVGAASLLLSLSIGVMYMGSAVLTWNSPLVPLGIIGFCIAGGVAANGLLRETLAAGAKKLGARLYLPELRLCGDNAAMVAAQGFYEYRAGNTAGLNLNGLATLGIDYL